MNLKDNAIQSLKTAIELDKKYVDGAKRDRYLRNIRTLKEFKDLIGE